MKSVTRRCSHCRKKVSASDALYGSLKAFCGTECLVAYAKSENGQKAYTKAVRKEIIERKEKLKPKSDYMKEAQASFNRYIRIRDLNKCCISSGRPLASESVGGGYDAGHYRSRGAASHLKFNLLNCWGQSKHDNRYLSGNVSEYRIGLIRRIGLERVEALEADNTPRTFTVEYLKRVKDIFNRRANLYQRKFR